MIYCFETLEMRGGMFFALEMHLDRLQRCAEATGTRLPHRSRINASLDQLRGIRILDGTPQGTGEMTSHRVRISCDQHGALIVTTAPMAGPGTYAQMSPADVVVERATTFIAESPLTGLKTNDYAHGVALLHHYSEAHEVIVLNDLGDVIGGIHSNVFLSTDGRLVTPPLSSGCRDGVTRSLLLDHLDRADIRVDEERVSSSTLSSSKGGFVCSTGRGVQPIGSIDGRGLSIEDPLITTAVSVFADVHGDAAMWG